MKFKIKTIFPLATLTVLFANYGFASEASESPSTRSMPKAVRTESKSWDQVPTNYPNSRKSNFIPGMHVDYNRVWRHASKEALKDSKEINMFLEPSIYKSSQDKKNPISK